MNSRLINVANTCKNAVCVVLKSVWSINVFGSKRSKKARDVINTVTVKSAYTPQEASSSVTNDLPQETALVLPIQQGMILTLAENSLSVVCDENLQSKTRTNRIRHKNVKFRLNTEDVLLADERGPANAKNAADISLSSHSNNEEEPCKSKAMVVNQPFCEAQLRWINAHIRKLRLEQQNGKESFWAYSFTTELYRLNNDERAEVVSRRHQRTPLKAKRVHFLVNGDLFCKIVVVAVTHKRFHSFDNLLAELTHILSENKHLPSGVRKIFSFDGHKITQLEDLEDGKYYICSSGNNLIQKLDFAALQCVNPSRFLPKPKFRKQLHLNIRPKIIFVVRSGPRPRKIIRILLNKRNSPSFEHVLTLITESIKLDTGAVHKVYMSSGCQIMQLEQFFEPDDLFFAYGSKQISHDDLKLDFEEMKIVQSHKRGLRKPVNELKNGIHYFDENGRRVPPLPKATKANRSITRSIRNKVLERYTIIDRIGDGSFGVVYRCFDKRNNTEYAMKVIKKPREFVLSQMIKNELSILKTLNHPNIIHFISELETPTKVYLITELVSGGDLFEAIDRCTDFSEREIRLMTKKLASALTYLHGMNIVHRDIKTKNVLVEFDSDGHVSNLKLADFSLSQEVIQRLYLKCGTAMYMAPEMLNNEGYDVKIDVWAVGVLLYSLLCGFPPFGSVDDCPSEMFNKISIGTYGFPKPYWDHVSEEAKDLIGSMLQSNPSLRLSAEDVLGHPWCDDYELRFNII